MSDRGPAEVKRVTRLRKRPAGVFPTAAIVPATDPDTICTYGVEILKVVQCEVVSGFLVSNPAGDEFTLYYCELPTALSQTGGGDHRSVYHGLQMAAHVRLLARLRGQFWTDIFVSNADRGPGGLACERLRSILDPGRPHLYGLGCMSHEANRCQKWQLQGLEGTVSGYIAYSLWERLPGRRQEFRNAIGFFVSNPRTCCTIHIRSTKVPLP